MIGDPKPDFYRKEFPYPDKKLGIEWKESEMRVSKSVNKGRIRVEDGVLKIEWSRSEKRMARERGTSGKKSSKKK